MESKDPVFPQELFDRIIDDLADDLEALRSCALVSSSFYQRARVFSHLRVGPLDEEHSVAALHNLLEGSLDFAARVESLHLWDHDVRGQGTGGAWMMSRSSAALESPAGQFLSRLVSLSRLSITLTGFLPHYWISIPSPFRESIRLTLARPSLTCLELTRINGLPLALLAHCPALRLLTLRQVSFEYDKRKDFRSVVAACAGSPPTLLERLSLDLESSRLQYFVHWILLGESPIDISCLRSLACSIYNDSNCFALQSLLTASATSLNHLRLIYCYSARLDLRGLGQLRTLSFDIAEPIKESMQLFARTLVFPPQTYALALNVCTSSIHHEIAQLIRADRTLADLPCIASVTAVFLPLERIGKEPHALELIDVSDKLTHKMPLLVSRLQGTGTLRILRSLRFPDHPW